MSTGTGAQRILRAVQGDPGEARRRNPSPFSAPGRSPTEEMALLGALAKFGMGIVHGDGNTRQCMATSTSPTSSRSASTRRPTPTGFRGVRRASSSSARISASRIRSCGSACCATALARDHRRRSAHDGDGDGGDPHYAIRPKSDLALLYGLAQSLIENGWIDATSSPRTPTGFDGIRRVRRALSARARGRGDRPEPRTQSRVRAHDLRGQARFVLVDDGSEPEPRRDAHGAGLINLALIRANRPARNGRQFDHRPVQRDGLAPVLATPRTCSAGATFNNAADRAKWRGVLGIDESVIPRQPWRMTRSSTASDGQIKGLWIVATNSAHSWINQADFSEILASSTSSSCRTCTPRPRRRGARIWCCLRRDGAKRKARSSTPSGASAWSRRSRARRARRSADFPIFKLIAHYWGCGEMFARGPPGGGFPILKRAVAGRPCDFAGIADYAQLDARAASNGRCGRTSSTRQERRLFEDGRSFTPTTSARNHLRRAAARADADRARNIPSAADRPRGTSSQWHTQTRTAKSAVLRRLYPASAMWRSTARRGAAAHRGRRPCPDQLASRRGDVVAFVTPPCRRAALRADALPRGQPPDLPRLRPVLAPPAYKSSAVQVELAGGGGGGGGEPHQCGPLRL